MEIKNALGVEFREVREVMHNGIPARSVLGSRVYATDQEDLWDALTNIERIPRWFLPIVGDLRLGGRYQLEGNAGGEITRCDRPNVLDLTWEFQGHVSWVTVRLEVVGEKTRLTLEHIMPKDDAGEAHWKEYGPGATGVGWELGFLGLGLHLDSKGETVDPQAVEEWSASAAGKAFILASATAWGEAHIISGETPATAHTMAEKTAAFYTGG